MKKTIPSRRQFLKGSFHGAQFLLSMPLLQSLLPRSTWAATVQSPMNFFLMYIPDGTFPHKIVNRKISNDNNMSLWYPAAGSLPAADKLPLFLKKMAPLRNDFSLLSGFRGRDHVSTAYFLTGNEPTSSQLTNLVSPNNSIDQIIGAKLAGSKSASAIQKFVSNSTLGAESQGAALAVTWGQYLTFNGGKPTSDFLDPLKLFNSVFGNLQLPPSTNPDNNENDLAKYVNPLDIVLEDIKVKRGLASSEDRVTLERWVDGYNDLRKRLIATGSGGGSSPGCAKPNGPSKGLGFDFASRKADSYGDKYDEICNHFLDIYLAAFECGARHVGTLMMQSESAKGYWWNQVVSKEDLHIEDGFTTPFSYLDRDKHVGMAHYGENGSDWKKYLALATLNNYYLRKYSYFING
ncbi:MAG: DUF1552 domain-containing protein, partial [Bdellovibrionales bacterium]|nr:DUF1552 domain-containing protein [Bdellovibrionales bacterium]